MNSEEIIKNLVPIMEDLFDEDDLKVTRQTTADDIEEWDSLTHIHFIVLAENNFNVKFTSLEIGEFNEVGDIVDAILSKSN